MAERFKDHAIFFVAKEPTPIVGKRFDACEVVEQFGDGCAAVACSYATKLAKGDKDGCYYVLAWTLGCGIKVVAEFALGELQPSHAYHSRDCAMYFAHTIMPRVSDYLDTQARSLSTPPADADCGEPQVSVSDLPRGDND